MFFVRAAVGVEEGGPVLAAVIVLERGSGSSWGGGLKARKYGTEVAYAAECGRMWSTGRRGGGRVVTASAAGCSGALVVGALDVSAVTVAAVFASADVCNDDESAGMTAKNEHEKTNQAGQSRRNRLKTAGLLPPALPGLQASHQGTQG